MAAFICQKLSVKRLWTTLICIVCIVFSSVSACAAETMRGYDEEEGYQYLELGTYPQTIDGGIEPILWRILSVDSGTVYAVSEYVLCHHRIHYDDVAYVREDGAFETTEMFEFLNGEFLQHFTEDEISLMIAGDDGGFVTLLSREDLKNADYGFTDDYSRRGYPTDYALNNGLFQYTNGSSPYWTLTQSTTAEYGAVCTKQDGNLGYIRVVVQNEGCRPVIRLDADKIVIESGGGSFYDPFLITVQEDEGV